MKSKSAEKVLRKCCESVAKVLRKLWRAPRDSPGPPGPPGTPPQRSLGDLPETPGRAPCQWPLAIIYNRFETLWRFKYA